ncbi:MAG: thioredoxin family protein, partial [Alphaproteobacteria bacterium]|nr:thioredoxin family protein [Alphaproteobacteria bacterium]
KPQIDLSQSENVKNIEVTLPIPLNSIKYPEAHKYFGDFIIPLKVEVDNVNNPVTLKGDIRLSACDNQLACDNYALKLEQTLMPHGDVIEPNGYGNYFNRNISALPKSQQKYLRFKKIFIDEYEGGQAVFLQFTTDKTVKNFKVFLEEVDGFTLFSTPILRLYDNRIDAIFMPLNKDADLQNSEFIITAGLNDLYNLRLTKKADTASVLEPDKNTLNVALILLAIFGGLILNFMPCVFPVLSLKIVSISRAEEKNRRLMKQSLACTCGGIYCSFAILIGALCLAKYLGYSLGWGMQFQNINFLVAMTFVLSGFIIIIRSVSFDVVSRFSDNRIGKATSFSVGALIVLLSTPCTAPYLATAVGFALSGTYFELITIMSAVAFGLSLPYLITLFSNEPDKIFPKPGKWMQKLHIVAQIMLLLTIMWLLNLIWLQTDAKFVLKMSCCILIFTWMFNIYHKFGLYLQGVLDERITAKMLLKIKAVSHIFMLVIFGLMLFWCCSAAQKSRTFNYARNMVNRHTELNQDIIHQKVANGRSVLLEVGADWCLTCHVNDALVLTESNLKNWQNIYNLDVIRIDWTNYSQIVLNYMEKFGRKGIPFYVLYTPYMREGMVLPEILAPDDLQNLLNNAAHR